MDEKTTIHNLEELGVFAKTLLQFLVTREKETEIIALAGDLGAGKTTFVQQLAKELGIGEVVTSPTFTIMKKYEITTPSKFEHLVHMDAYRIESLDEVRPLGLELLMQQPRNLFCIEWAEKITAVLPEQTIYLKFVSLDEKTREVTFMA